MVLGYFAAYSRLRQLYMRKNVTIVISVISVLVIYMIVATLSHSKLAYRAEPLHLVNFKNKARFVTEQPFTGSYSLCSKLKRPPHVPHAARRISALNRQPCCPVKPKPVGPFLFNESSVPSIENVSAHHPELKVGGRWRPKSCFSRHRVAIIIPYRDRGDNLAVFLNHMHTFLQGQFLDYGIFVVEQEQSSRWNKGLIMNAGFLEAGKHHVYDCFIFHDVDQIPLNIENMYSCPRTPRHMTVAVDEYNHKLLYPEIFGGVVAFLRKHFEKVNGFSNKYTGWGGEDDNMFRRVVNKGLAIARYPGDVAVYHALAHQKQVDGENYAKLRADLLSKTEEKQDVDGLSSLRYRVLNTELRRLYTWIHVQPV